LDKRLHCPKESQWHGVASNTPNYPNKSEIFAGKQLIEGYS
jgi:hypothetical protein